MIGSTTQSTVGYADSVHELSRISILQFYFCLIETLLTDDTFARQCERQNETLFLASTPK